MRIMTKIQAENKPSFSKSIWTKVPNYGEIDRIPLDGAQDTRYDEKDGDSIRKGKDT